MIDSGILKLYTLENKAESGRMPKEMLVEVGSSYYSELTVGYNRMYAALGANQQIDELVRCHNMDIPIDAKYVVLEDGYQYRITAKQKIIEKDAVDLTLVRLEKMYDVFNG